ncbi:junctional adhesion molecule-like isoform X4 [Anomaloglossus baeobatrachus]|uniref:junctional adhesion molecule-like isoform X4 n=1 Tax=Anomaloglossus baeobatrachus TaxID=238106 RepID=UPI003F5021FC
MDVCPGWIICLILSITGLVAPVAQVTVSLNGTVVLPCKYTAETTTMCWGRGACPKSKCSDEIISTDGQRVTKRKSDRYHILGNISQGDVSLTITRVTKEDEGTYCCRVEIHGPFNDEKTEVELRIQDGGGGPFSVTTASTDHHSVTTEDNMFSTIVSVSGEVVTGSVNGPLTLPCTYMVYTHHHPLCWGRGGCPVSKCSNGIIRTDGQRVTWKKSDRYKLLGNMSQGDVSLTITGVTKEDEGTYCCRVEIPGLLNDMIEHVEVIIQDMSNNPSTFTTERTSSTLKETQTTVKSTSITTSVIVGVFGAIFLITLTGVIIYIYKYRKWKNTKTESEMSVINIEALEGTGNEATENIYT